MEDKLILKFDFEGTKFKLVIKPETLTFKQLQEIIAQRLNQSDPSIQSGTDITLLDKDNF